MVQMARFRARPIDWAGWGDPDSKAEGEEGGGEEKEVGETHIISGSMVLLLRWEVGDGRW